MTQHSDRYRKLEGEVIDDLRPTLLVGIFVAGMVVGSLLTVLFRPAIPADAAMFPDRMSVCIDREGGWVDPRFQPVRTDIPDC